MVIVGRVQGVGFRMAARAHARTLGLAGSARNAADGSVRVVVEGAPRDVDRMLRWLRQGPPGAHVTHIDVEDLPSDGRLAGFEIE